MASVLLRVGAVALSACALYLSRPGAVTDDTYAMLDWGRDLRHGLLPALQGRTFHPVLILLGSGLSLLGSAAPVVTLLLSLVAFVLLAAGCWKVLECLGVAQPAPALAAALVLASPLLPILAFVAYNNLPFATFVVWAIVFELERRPVAPWMLLLAAGLLRPEGWVYLLGYGLLTWCRRGTRGSRQSREAFVVLSLAVAVPLVWLGLEWWLLGDPLYSFHHVSTFGHRPFDTGPGKLVDDLRDTVLWPVIGYAAVGAVALAAWSAPRERQSFLAMAALAPTSIAILLALRFPLPSRHLSVLAALVIVLAAAGATAPAEWLRRRHPRLPRGVIPSVSVAGAAGLIGLAVPVSVRSLRYYVRTIGTEHAMASALAIEASRAAPDLVAGSPAPGSVALLGANAMPEIAWTLGVPFVDVSDRITRSTRVLVEPSRVTWSSLHLLGLTKRPFVSPGLAWQLVANGPWEIYRANSPAGQRASKRSDLR